MGARLVLYSSDSDAHGSAGDPNLERKEALRGFVIDPEVGVKELRSTGVASTKLGGNLQSKLQVIELATARMKQTNLVMDPRTTCRRGGP